MADAKEAKGLFDDVLSVSNGCLLMGTQSEVNRPTEFPIRIMRGIN